MQAERIDIGWIDPEYVSGHFAHSIASQVRDMEYFGCAGQVHRYTASQPIMARNQLFQDFLDNSDSPWLWQVDADMVFDKGHVMKLWTVASEHEVKMVTGLAMIFKDQRLPIPSIFWDGPDGSLRQVYNRIPKEPARIAASGLATVLIHRDVIEAMQPARHPMYRWFDFIPNEDLGVTGDEMTGIDVQFFLRARKLGYPLMVEPDAKTFHLEQIGVGYPAWQKAWNMYDEEE